MSNKRRRAIALVDFSRDGSAQLEENMLKHYRAKPEDFYPDGKEPPNQYLEEDVIKDETCSNSSSSSSSSSSSGNSSISTQERRKKGCSVIISNNDEVSVIKTTSETFHV